MAARHPDKRCQTQNEQCASCCVSVNTQPDELLAFWLPGKNWTRDVAVSHFASHISNDGTRNWLMHVTTVCFPPRFSTSSHWYSSGPTAPHCNSISPYLSSWPWHVCYPAPIVMPCVRFPV